MAYISKKDDIKNHIYEMILNGSLKDNDPLFEKKYFTSKFKVNPSYVDKALTELEREGYIYMDNDKYKLRVDDPTIMILKDRFLNTYVNDFLDSIDKIGVSIDEAIEILDLRNGANG